MGSFVFGEIVEPSTRALITDYLDEYPDYSEPLIEWEGHSQLPAKIKTLIFADTENVLKVLYNNILHKQSTFCNIKNANVKVYSLPDSVYIVTSSQPYELTPGQITELFGKWLNVAETIYAITSESIGKYQNSNLIIKPPSLIRMISSDESKTPQYQRLEPPNLITGLGASILSYCIHLSLKCALFIAYIDSLPLDSVNIGPLLELFKKIGLPVTKYVNPNISSHNLYM